MTLCINPRCDNPQNSDNAQFCQSCQSSLLLKQRYRAMRVLGEGGFGKTYEASDLGIQNKVIKVLINNSPKAVELFQREAEELSRLNNPGIPKVEPNSYIVFHPVNSQEPVHCLVMEKVEGMNLRDYLKRLGQPIDSETAERWLRELVLILQEVHERGIIHRDIKPQNIIFKPDGKLALIDFGAVSKGTGTEVATAERSSGGGTEVASNMAGGTSIFSGGYTAPEQMNGQAVRQSDFYSLGRTFVFLLTGREPSEIPYDTHDDVLQWRRYAANVELKLADLLDQMQSTLVRQRPASTQEILQKLQSGSIKSQPITEDIEVKSTLTDSNQPLEITVKMKPGEFYRAHHWLSCKYIHNIVISIILIVSVYGIPIYFIILLFFYISSFSNEYVKKTFTYRILNEGIEIFSQDKKIHSTKRFAWDKIKKIYETNNNFILVTEVVGVIIIPRRVLNNPEKINQFKQILQFKLTELYGIKNIDKIIKFSSIQ